MEASEEIKNIMKLYFKEKHIDQDFSNFIIKMNPIDGMTNQNYHIIYYNKNSPENINEILYRKYGDILDLSEHKKEIYIINYLSGKKEGPSVLYTAPNYRIVEYIKNSNIIPLELRYDKKILNEVIDILCNYTLISNVYKYELNPELNKELYYNNIKGNNDTYIFPSLFDICEKLLKKAKSNYGIFNNKFNEFLSKNDLNENIKAMKAKYDLYMNDYKNIFISLFPKKGFFILCHNDCQRWNFLYKDLNTKIFIIDHEYACLGLPGLDLCNYFNENSFYFYDNGSYEFKKDEINFELYYENYMKYCNFFLELNKKWINNEENKEFINNIKSKEYYMNLHSITNVFWFLFCVINLNFEEDIVKKDSHYFEYGYDRLCYSELAKKNQINNK